MDEIVSGSKCLKVGDRLSSFIHNSDKSKQENRLHSFGLTTLDNPDHPYQSPRYQHSQKNYFRSQSELQRRKRGRQLPDSSFHAEHANISFPLLPKVEAGPVPTNNFNMGFLCPSAPENDAFKHGARPKQRALNQSLGHIQKPGLNGGKTNADLPTRIQNLDAFVDTSSHVPSQEFPPYSRYFKECDRKSQIIPKYYSARNKLKGIPIYATMDFHKNSDGTSFNDRSQENIKANPINSARTSNTFDLEDRENITNSCVIQCRNHTLTMQDACRIAREVQSQRQVDFKETENAPSLKTNVKRKCWAKACWSSNIHSHSSLLSQVELLSLERDAIVKSMKTPIHTAQQKEKLSCWPSCFKTSLTNLQLWNSTLKQIEGQFGTGVVSYFVFLRWLIILNFVIFILYFLLIILPYSASSYFSQRSIKIAPNSTLVTDKYLDQFPKYKDVEFKEKTATFGNVTFDVDTDLLGNLGSLLDNYLPDEILDVSLRYDKSNYTAEQRIRISRKCAERYHKEMSNRTTSFFSYFQDFLQGTGWLQSTVLFLGSYPDSDISYFGLIYNLPVCFLAVLVASFFLSLVLMLQFSSEGVQENILTRKSNYLTFSNILFCSWDYCIEDRKTADVRHKSITCEIKSNLSEERRLVEVKSWSSEVKAKVFFLRSFSHLLVLTLLFGSFYLIYRVVNFQLEMQRRNALSGPGAYILLVQFLPPLVITGLNILMPIVFSNMVKLEMYAVRTQVNLTLFRVVFLRLASVFVLVSTLHQQITCQPKDDCNAGKSDHCQTPLCWETYVGQQLYKLVITDFLVYVFMYLGYDLPRDCIVKAFKSKITEVIGRQVFDLPSQVLSLVYSQTLCWLGLFYSPLLSGITVLKFLVVFYIKKNVVLSHCIPAPVLYKASRSNYIFMMILIISFFLVTVINGYALTSIEPSPGCSPFRQYKELIDAIPDAIYDWSPTFVSFLSYLFSGFFFIPSFLLLCIIIYYYWTVVVAQREMTKVLKAQIAIEGRDKQFLLNRLADTVRQASCTRNL